MNSKQALQVLDKEARSCELQMLVHCVHAVLKCLIKQVYF